MSRDRSLSSSSIAGHIEIAGQGVSPEGQRFVLLRFPTAGQTVERLLRVDTFDRARITRLNQAGARLVTDAALRELLKRIQGLRPSKDEFLVATRLGWHGCQFALPSGIVGEGPVKHLYLDGLDPAQTSKFRSRGTLKGWKRLARLARGNTRFTLALSLAFTGPVGDLLGVEQPAFQLVGDAGTGKTTLAVAAGSIWGRHLNPERGSETGFGESWNATLNSMEPLAAAHNHTLLILDETKTAASPRDVLSGAMRLAGGVEKGRFGSDQQGSWWMPVISTSNRTLDQLAPGLAEEAHRGRLIDVPSPAGGHGVFETLHGRRDVGGLSAELLQLAEQNFGVAGAEFVRRIVADRQDDAEALIEFLGARRAGWLSKANAMVTSGRDLSRFKNKLATVYAAGALAIRYNLLPFRWNDLRDALIICLQAHVSLIGPEADQPGTAVVERLRAYVRLNRPNLIDLRKGLIEDPNHSSQQCLGYLYDRGGSCEFLVASNVLDAALGRSAAKELKEALLRQSQIRQNGGGRGEKGRFAVKVPIFANTAGRLKRVYLIAIAAEAAGFAG